ncbi:N/A [soil metagenome]
MSLLRCRGACATHQGRRPSNQDSVISLRLPDGREIIAVADGMGGAAVGEIASGWALEVLTRELRAGAGLKSAVQAANGAVHAAGRENPAYGGMGTTLVALLRTGATYEIANVGDSRAYYLDASTMRQLTLDHSFVAEAVRAGGLSHEEASRSPWRNVVTRILGTKAEVEVDLFGPFEIGLQPHAILMCSDGLYKGLADPVIHQHLLSAEDAQAAVGKLSSFAFLGGSTDNITVAVMEFGSFFRSCDVPTLPFDGPAHRGDSHPQPARASGRVPFHATGGTHVH